MWRGPVSRKFIYFCLSADTKQIIGIEPFSICFETDTEKKYTFDGATWQEDIEEPVMTTLYASNGEVINPATSTVQTDGSQVTKVSDGYGFEVENTPMGEMRTVIPIRLIGTTFIGTTLDTNFATATLANGGTATQANCQLIVRTNTTANGSAIIQSKRTARYNGGSANRCRGIIQLSDTGKVNNIKKWGCFSVTDGAYFKLSGTAISVNILKGGAETSVALANWNGTAFTVDTSIHSYEVYYTNSKVYFVIDDILRHTVSASAATWSDTTNLPIRIENTNSGNSATDTSIYCRVATIYRLGNLITQPTSYYQSGTTAGVVLKYGAGNLHSIVLSGIANTSTVTLYDNTAASGTIIWSSGSMGSQTAPFPIPLHGLPFYIGLTLVIANANSNATVIYE